MFLLKTSFENESKNFFYFLKKKRIKELLTIFFTLLVIAAKDCRFTRETSLVEKTEYLAGTIK
jgi:hypothetical protein